VFPLAAKIFWFLLQPSSVMVGAVIVGALLMATAWRRLARALLWGAVAALLICGLTPLGAVLIRPLEQRFPRTQLEPGGPPVTGIIVLGGAEDSRAMDPRELASLNEAAERYTEAVVLARRLPEARLVFTGGSGALLRTLPPEAQAAGRLFLALGIARERLVLEDKSRDTFENAALTAQLVNPKPGERWLLVTSAWHMPRAMGCFRRAGFDVVPWPVDYRAPREASWLRFNSSVPEGLRRIDFVTREYVGLVAYYLSGRTSALFPAP
jgi:uncharacterized SAM-binding protein YcdF (DUF218 family)